MNKYKRNEKRDVFVGRTAEGGRIFLDFAYSEVHPVMISGEHIPYRCRNADNAGQMVYRVSEIVTFAYGWDAEKLEEVRKIWDQYQLASVNNVPAEVAAKVKEWTNSPL